jgi:hypothetical protein
VKVDSLWDIAPCNLVKDDRFRGACCLHCQGVDGVRTSETSVYFETTRRYLVMVSLTILLVAQTV